MAHNPLVLFAEDDDEDWLLVEDALADSQLPAEVERVKDGQTLLARLRDLKLREPDLIMLDLKMPRMDGGTALREIRKDHALRHMPVVVMTTSQLEADIFNSYYEGANTYVVKPVTFDAMSKVLQDLHYYWIRVARLPKKVDNA